MRRLLALLAALACLVISNPASAHPLGSFTTNVHVGVVLDEGVTVIHLVVDMAEIPAFRETRGAVDTSQNGVVAATEASNYAAVSCGELEPNLSLQRNGERLDLTATDSAVSFPPGEGNLTTLRLECSFEAAPLASGDRISLDNQVYVERIGWSEIVLTSNTLAIGAAGIPSTSPSAVLTEYPPGPPLDMRSADLVLGTPSEIRVAPMDIGPLASLGANLSQTAGLAALAVAAGLGAVHALAPGHGKTLMAAYLVGRQGSARQAMILGLSVAVAHTAGVAILGVVTLVASESFQPDRIYPWLSAASAGIVTVIGVVMLVRAFSDRHHHHHHDDHHDRDHHERHDHHERSSPPGWRAMVTLGLAGGMVPSASAVVLLLGGVSTGRPWFGLALVAGFGVGMSVALVGAGLAALGLSRMGWKLLPSDRLRHQWQHVMPRLAGVAVTCIGLILVWNAA